jgi:hypothetical protein
VSSKPRTAASTEWIVRSLRLAPFVFLACAATVHVGHFNLQASSWEAARVTVSSRAAFELKCPEDKLSLTVLDVIQDAFGDVPRQIGVDGCDHRLVYVASPSGWVLNSDSGEGAK